MRARASVCGPAPKADAARAASPRARCIARACTAVLAALLAGCAALAPRGPAPPARVFELLGRVAVAYEGRAFSSALRWQHGQARDEIWLLSPTGQILAHIVSEGAAGATLAAPGEREYRAASVEELMRRALGWELPLARLAWWVQGEIAPGAEARGLERDAAARLTALEQDGWRVALDHFPQERHGGLPRRLELTSATGAIRLVIDAWMSDPGAAVPGVP